VWPFSITCVGNACVAFLWLCATAPDVWRQALVLTKQYAENALAKSSEETYNFWYSKFLQFCAQAQRVALPADPQTLAAFLAFLAQSYAYSSIKLAVAAVSFAHKTVRYEAPVSDVLVWRVLEGIKRVNGNKQTPKQDLTRDHLLRMLDLYNHGLVRPTHFTRNFAMMLLGFAGLLRRSEIVYLRIRDVTFAADDKGITLYVAKSKRDQGGQGAHIFISATDNQLCPVRWLKAWLQMHRRREPDSYLFCQFPAPTKGLAGQTVANILKDFLSAIGENPVNFSAHSLRHGGAAALVAAGVPDQVIQAFGRWSLNSDTYRRYAALVRRPGLSAFMLASVQLPSELRWLRGLSDADLARLMSESRDSHQ